MRLIQSLASKELVRNLPKLKFDQHFCDACKMGRQAHASHKAKNIVSTTRCLELLHMDIFGPSTVRSYGGNRYTLVIVDDYSKKPTLDYFRVFGRKCFILNTKDYLTKFDLNSYEESLNVTFDETPPPSKTSPLVDDDLYEEEAIRQTKKKNLENVVEDETLEIDEKVNIKGSRNHPLENVIGNLNQRTLRLKAFLIKHEYKMGMVDNTLFTKKKSSNLIILQIYVDDIIFGSTCQDMCDEFSKIMHDEFEMSMMGELNFFLGLQIKQMEDGIFFNQSKYIKEMLKKFGLEDSKPMKTPMSSDTKLTKDKECESIDSTKYRGMIGCGLTSWFSKKQTTLAISTTEAEYFYSQYRLSYSDEGQIFVEFVIQNQYFSFSLEDFAQILRIPCEGACVFSDSWSLDKLVYGAHSEVPYQSNIPSPDDIISYIREDREGQVTHIRHQEEIEVQDYQILTREIVSTLKPLEEIIWENVFCFGGNWDHVPACLCYMIYYVANYKKFNLAYFMAKRMEWVTKQARLILPYGMLLTHLFNFIIGENPELQNESYVLYDRVMNPLAA
ncbi:copia protein [Tanacetum coccineum]